MAEKLFRVEEKVLARAIISYHTIRILDLICCGYLFCMYIPIIGPFHTHSIILVHIKFGLTYNDSLAERTCASVVYLPISVGLNLNLHLQLPPNPGRAPAKIM